MEITFQSVKYMKVISLLVLVVPMLYAGVNIVEFNGYAEEARIIIQWTTSQEDEILGFQIQRSTDGQSFIDIGFLQAQGGNSGYTFIDDSIIAKVSGRSYLYRLKIRNMDGSFESSDILTIESQISSVKHTWGSLKALFK